jgi:predicted flap endonuclease-1-like 5' DNA nuclease
MLAHGCVDSCVDSIVMEVYAMNTLTWLWFLGAGFLLGWIVSTLTEWLWFRRRRMQQSRPRSEPLFARATEPDNVAEDQRAEVAANESLTANAQRDRGVAVYPHPEGQGGVESATREQGGPVRSAGYPDPLWKIRGIGIIYQKRLYEAGIFTWHQLAVSDPESLRVAARAHASSDPNVWIEQARQLAEQHNRVGALYMGPIPDDFTVIDGIGSNSEQELYRAGIYTYAQLASLAPQKLASILPEVAAAGDTIDFRIWLEQAAQLSTAA